MTKKKLSYLIVGIFASVVLLTCGLTVAFADKEGTAEDPLIAKSYIDEVFTPQIMAIVDDAVAEIEDGYLGEIQTLIDTYTKKIEDKVNELNAQAGGIASNEAFIELLNQKIADKVASVSVPPSGDNETFKVITLQSGQRVTCDVGCEVMLRIGSAKASGSVNPVMIDIALSTELRNGAALSTNHLYLVTIKDNGFQATANNTKLLIRGSYPIG